MKRDLIVIKQLDQHLLPLQSHGVRNMPREGWVRTIRKSLGMTIMQLAHRLKVNPARVVKIETSELRGAVTLHTLQVAAEAMECRLVYFIVPKTTFEDTVNKQAKEAAARRIKKTIRTMDLESQSVSPEWIKSQTDDLEKDLMHGSWKHLWEDNDV